MGFQHLDQTGKKNRAYKHGKSRTPTWNSWSGMLKRVDGKDRCSHLYIGVKVCKRWRTFSNFFADMGERPKGKTLDRYPNGRGDYKPSNCRWATPKEQSDNSRPRPSGLVYKNSNLIAIKGVSKTLAQWSRQFGLSPQVIRYRMKVGKPLSGRKHE